MRKKSLYGTCSTLFVLLTMLTFLCTLVASANAEVKDDKLILTKQDQNKEVKLKAGDIIQIELEGLGSAGYWWYIDNLDSEHLELLSEETKPLSAKIGAPTLGIWTFKVKKQGNTKIKMDHYRKWEGIEKANNNFLIKLHND